jgi:hypothetical protein
MAVAKTLAYYNTATITDVVSFIVKAPGAQPILRVGSTRPSTIIILDNCEKT